MSAIESRFVSFLVEFILKQRIRERVADDVETMNEARAAVSRDV